MYFVEIEDSRQADFDFELVNKIIDSSSKILIHCQQGISRAPTAVLGYLMKTGMTLGQAASLVRSARPNIGASGSHSSEISSKKLILLQHRPRFSPKHRIY